jgi:non-ribosomal peptide synthetase component F
VGFFVNTLVLRSDCSPGQTFREYLAQIKSLNLNAQANQDVPFEYLVERLKPQRSTSHAPLFQIMFNMNTNDGGAAQSQDLQFRRLRGGQVTVKFDLTLDAVEETDEVWLSFTYNTDLFDESTVVRLGEHFQNLARGVAANPDQRIELLPLLANTSNNICCMC